MKTLTLKNKFQANVTLVTNDFIDNYMAAANGEFVKVYLFLLRHLDDSCSGLTVSTIADCLNNTENDILRAFRYWESEGLLSLENDENGRIIGIGLERTPSSVSRRVTAPKDSFLSPDAGCHGNMPQAPSEPAPGNNAIPLTSFKAQKEMKSLLFIAEQYLGKTLSRTDVDAITYFYESLNMSADLIEYLIESCVENGHKSIHYIQKVALSWNDSGIVTVEQAKQRSADYNKNCYTVLGAFGIRERGPAPGEVALIRKWTEQYGFTLDIIQEACSRTIAATHQPSFDYADTILTRWYDNQVRHLKDITALDTAYQKEKAARRSSEARPKPVSKNLNNFERRAYDMDSLEEQLLNSN